MAAQLRHPLPAATPRRPRPRLRLLRSRRGWWQRFWDPQEMFGLKVTLLLTCFLTAAALSG